MLEELLALAIEDPDVAWRRAEELLDAASDPLTRSYAHHCRGIVLRDAGRTRDAVAELRAAARAARVAGDADRGRDVGATLGVALVLGGRTRAGLAALDQALDGASGPLAAKVRMRQAGVLAVLGRHEEAASSMQRALAEIRAVGDPVWEARTRIWLAHIHQSLGDLRRAEREVVEATRLFDVAGVTLERLTALENQAEIAVARGDLARGLGLFGAAAEAYRAGGHPLRLETVSLHARAYLAAGLASEAVGLFERFDVGSLGRHQQADFHLGNGTALLGAGRADRALAELRRARTMFRAQGRSWFELRARLAAATARTALDDTRGLARELREVAAALHAEHADEAPQALVLAGRLAPADERRELWAAAAGYRTHPNALVRAAAALGRALEREQDEDRAGVLRACATGLAALDEHRRLIGSSELRAVATGHGRELTAVALRHAAADPRTLLRWSERTRATALAEAPATSDAATIPVSLAALRDNGRRLAEARQAGEPTDELERERLRLERAVRAESHALAATADEEQRPASVEEVVHATGDEVCLVELVDVDGRLHVLVVHGGRVRRRVAGTTAEVAELMGPARMLLRRAARGRPADTTAVGQRLQDAILGPAAGLLPAGLPGSTGDPAVPVVLAPTARLHGLPWPLLPALGRRPFSVVPSAGQWLRARATPPPADRTTVLVAAPGLASGGAEVPVLAGRRPGAVLLEGADATVAGVLDRIDGADLVHLAAHGSFRADSPLFSALDLADGPLTVHDLERLRRAPYRVVLSACESGVLAPVGAEELLGLTAALLSIGTAGLVAAVGEVNDAATAELMVHLHGALEGGADPATALAEVRRAAAGDPVASGTAAAFLALGV